MLATVRAGRYPRVRISPVDNATILATLKPGNVLEVPTGTDGRPYVRDGYMFVLMPGYQPSVGWTWLEFYELTSQGDPGIIEELRAQEASLLARLAASQDTLRIAGRVVEKIGVACGEWEAWDE